MAHKYKKRPTEGSFDTTSNRCSLLVVRLLCLVLGLWHRAVTALVGALA